MIRTNDVTAPALLRQLFAGAVAAANPTRAVAETQFPAVAGRTVIVGAGKAAAAMARAAATAMDGDPTGIVIVPYGHGLPLPGIEVVEAGHPAPDAAGEAAARRILELSGSLQADDLLVVLISGGGSALLAVPAPGLRLDDKRAIAAALMQNGAPIGALNAVRKHLSAIKGGQLAVAAHPAQTLTLAVSDVPGDDPATIASGPTVGDPTTLADARAALARFGVEPAAHIAAWLADAAHETPKPGDPELARARFRMVVKPQDALAAAAAIARDAAFEVVNLGDAVEGEARTVARSMAELARTAQRAGQRQLLLSGGEVTVTRRGSGRGGPNAEFALALAVALDSLDGVHALACDTDGIDGQGPEAGAVIGPDTLARAREQERSAEQALAQNDAHEFFAALGDSVTTGPTRTNVNDFRAILIAPH